MLSKTEMSETGYWYKYWDYCQFRYEYNSTIVHFAASKPYLLNAFNTYRNDPEEIREATRRCIIAMGFDVEIQSILLDDMHPITRYLWNVYLKHPIEISTDMALELIARSSVCQHGRDRAGD